MSDNLPAIPFTPPFKDRPDAVKVISHGDMPPIIQRLQRVQVSEELYEIERARYEHNAKTATLTPAEKAAKAAMDALGDGRVLIDVERTLAGSIGNRQMNTLALGVARPSRKEIYLHVDTKGGDGLRYHFYEKKPRKPFLSIDGADAGKRADGYRRYVAQVPEIPAEIRLAHPEFQSDPHYLVMWEVEWTQIGARDPRPPRLDPALLYQVSGVLYSVVAVWNLTEVEKAALKPGPQF